MISKEIAKYSLETLRKRKSRSLLTITSILAGITTIFIFVSFGLGLYLYVNSFIGGTSADKITIQSKGNDVTGESSFGLGDKDLTTIKRTSGVFDATGYFTKIAQVKDRDTVRYAFIAGMDPAKKELVNELAGLKLDVGRELQSGEVGKAVMGYSYKLDNKIFQKGLSINDEIEIQGQRVKVVGFYQQIGNPQDDANIYVTDDFFKEIYPDTNYYYMIIARADASNVTKVVKNIDKNLLNERGLKSGQEDYTVASFDQLLESYSSALNIVIGFIILIALISVLVSAINTSNTMITSVIERTKEIGVLKSIGARNSEILTLFLFESSVLGFIAGSLGVVLGFLITKAGGEILKVLGYSFLQPNYSIWLFIGCILFATLTGAISGVAPAISASKISPVKALRYE